MSTEVWGIAGIIITIIVGIPAYFGVKNLRSKRQIQKVSPHGVGYQAGRDNNIKLK